MSSYSVAEAKNNLPKLLDRMLAGEDVTITRRGKAIARLEPQEKVIRQPSADVDWLRQNLLTTPNGPDAVELVRLIREDR